jgi:hypothetical protein
LRVGVARLFVWHECIVRHSAMVKQVSSPQCGREVLRKARELGLGSRNASQSS